MSRRKQKTPLRDRILFWFLIIFAVICSGRLIKAILHFVFNFLSQNQEHS